MKIIITGATGFVGEGVLFTCLSHPGISEVLMLNRRHYDHQHPKLKELIVKDYFSLGSVSASLTGYDACFYCAGKSSVGMNEKDYTFLTYDTTLALAKTLLELNPSLGFFFISGGYTDSSEKGKIMWARVKGKTENALLKMGFSKAYNFRPGGMIPLPGQKNAKGIYTILSRILSVVVPRMVSTVEQVGLAMINVAKNGYPRQILEVTDIKIAAK